MASQQILPITYHLHPHKSLLKEAQDDLTTRLLLCLNFEDEEKNTPVKPLLPRVSSYTTTSAAAPNNYQQRRCRTTIDSSLSSHSFSDDTPVLILITNQLRKDLTSTNKFEW
ncbi:hypothetical protein ACFX16_042837 [Malus domestica]